MIDIAATQQLEFARLLYYKSFLEFEVEVSGARRAAFETGAHI